MKFENSILLAALASLSINCVADEIKLTDEEHRTFAKVCRSAYEATVDHTVEEIVNRH